MPSINVPGATPYARYQRQAPLPTPEIGAGKAISEAGKQLGRYSQQRDKVRMLFADMQMKRQKAIEAREAAEAEAARNQALDEEKIRQFDAEEIRRKDAMDRADARDEAQRKNALEIAKLNNQSREKVASTRGGRGEDLDERTRKFTATQTEILKTADSFKTNKEKIKYLQDLKRLTQVRLDNAKLNKEREGIDFQEMDKFQADTDNLSQYMNDVDAVLNLISGETVRGTAPTSAPTGTTSQPNTGGGEGNLEGYTVLDPRIVSFYNKATPEQKADVIAKGIKLKMLTKQ